MYTASNGQGKDTLHDIWCQPEESALFLLGLCDRRNLQVEAKRVLKNVKIINSVTL